MLPVRAPKEERNTLLELEGKDPYYVVAKDLATLSSVCRKSVSNELSNLRQVLS